LNLLPDRIKAMRFGKALRGAMLASKLSKVQLSAIMFAWGHILVYNIFIKSQKKKSRYLCS